MRFRTVLYCTMKYDMHDSRISYVAYHSQDGERATTKTNPSCGVRRLKPQHTTNGVTFDFRLSKVSTVIWCEGERSESEDMFAQFRWTIQLRFLQHLYISVLNETGNEIGNRASKYKESLDCFKTTWNWKIRAKSHIHTQVQILSNDKYGTVRANLNVIWSSVKSWRELCCPPGLTIHFLFLGIVDRL